MRRAARLAFTIITTLSLLLCVGVCVLWVRSGTGRDTAETTRVRREADGAATAVWFRVTSSDRLWLWTSFARVGRPGGGIRWDSYYERADATGGRWRFWFNHARRTYPETGGWGGFRYGPNGWGPLRWSRWTQREPAVPFVQRNVTLGVSHWLAAALFAVLPAWAATRRLARRRRARLLLKRGLCRACGYDLRASPARCPECGAVAAIRGGMP